MLAVRAARPSDLDAVLRLAAGAGPGMTTLKADRQALGARLELAQASFAQTVAPELRDYVFVLEDSVNGRLGGIAAIKAAVGLDEPFYSYRLGTLVHSAAAAGVYARHQVLYLSHDLTGSAELCSLFLHPDYQGGGNGRLLSKSRLLFIAQFPQLFTRGVFAEMRGFQDAGVSPFWESVGRKFFGMDFARADDMCQPGAKSYIAELMPRYPLYTCLLSDAARAAIGRTHSDTAPARRLLEQEGLRAGDYIDIFDGGPVLQADVRDLRATRDSVTATVHAAAPGDQGSERKSLACTLDAGDFRVIAAGATATGGTLRLRGDELHALQCDAGRTIRVLDMAAPQPMHQIGAAA